jgi:hypothetical protein
VHGEPDQAEVAADSQRRADGEDLDLGARGRPAVGHHALPRLLDQPVVAHGDHDHRAADELVAQVARERVVHDRVRDRSVAEDLDAVDAHVTDSPSFR